ERDDIPMLLRNIELPRFPRSTSMCMPVRDEDYEEDTYVPHTGPLSSQPSSQVAAAGNPFVVSRHTPDNRPPRHPQAKQVSKPQAVMPEDAGGNRWSHGGDIPKNEHLMMSGPLGQCDNPDCVHCPPVCKNKRHFQRAPNHFDNKDKKCIVFNWKLATGLAVVRSVSDAIYFLHMLLQFRLAYVAPESRVVGAGDLVDEPKKIAVHYLRGYFLLDFFVVLPLPQVIILAIIPRSFGLSTTADDAKNYLRVIILLQYVPRIIRFVPLLGGRQSATGFIFESAWANFVINLLMFVLAGHVVGSCWYLFGLQRVNQCLQNACSVSNISSCKVFRDCGLNFDIGGQNEQISQQWVNEPASTACFDTGNDTNFQYGIYQQAVLLATKHSAVTRYVYSLFWGFQQISTLAGNLIPSYFEGEVLFTMAIVGLGLLLFALLIGNMQNFLQALGSRKLEMQLRRRDVEQWMSHRRLPEDLRRRVRHAERFTWAATQGVNEEELLSNLPEDIQRDIRRHFFRFLNKVRLFTLMDWPILDAICDKN
uniref:Ion transport domain-containing protein n=1 Tax=Aegilops tauschii subsp. strangulata TaxID=200361 RepID=A0A453PNV3_AEGTS